MQHLAHLSDKIIGIFFRTRQTKATLTTEWNLSLVSPTKHTYVYAVSAKLLPTSQHLLNWFFILFTIKARMDGFETFPMVNEYFLEGFFVGRFLFFRQR
ncbi:MAG: hypothetical protein U9R43_05105 [Thermodesulfobacteriota bacterium]|nr:hypothetical protein [Thermodesulfobacteriota bacterium]